MDKTRQVLKTQFISIHDQLLSFLMEESGALNKLIKGLTSPEARVHIPNFPEQRALALLQDCVTIAGCQLEISKLEREG